MNLFTRRVLFILFLLSGVSSLVYQVVWTRLAFASFGIITPVLSVVLSVFMLGLAAGSWLGGRWIGRLTARTGWSAAFFYAGAELVIGLGAFAAPKLFAVGETVLLAAGETDSAGYLFLSALVLAVAILPWCLCMGTTFPFMMAYIREREGDHFRSFSFLYLANVLGAMTGTFLSAVALIELLGFHRTLWVAAAGNFTIALVSVGLGLARRPSAPAAVPVAWENPPVAAAGPAAPDGINKWILFSTGFMAMAMEVVWTRAFTPVLKTQVYSFALIVFVYLGATFAGSWVYRRDARVGRAKSKALVLAILALSALFPVLANSPDVMVAEHAAPTMDFPSALILLASIVPFCGLLGYLTPGLIDEYSRGNPDRAGRAYSINVLGCILGPLAACYVLLPYVSERYSLILLALPVPAFCLRFRTEYSREFALTLLGAVTLALGWSMFGTEDFDTWRRKNQPETVIRRDYTATVTSFGVGRDRKLLVNGFGMTSLTPITKYMVHLPLALHKTPPKSALVICFGMGTTFRSAMNWNIDTTAVELVPSVTKAFDFYHADAERFLNATNGRIVIDDGRRFLRRSTRKYDVIVVDPPPPPQAAGSSLLFSEEFYVLAKQHLNPGGLVQMWVPGDVEPKTGGAVLRSMCAVFPHVRCFRSALNWGTHLLASMDPIEVPNAEVLAGRMPAAAREDLLEWFDTTNTPLALNLVLSHEFDAAGALDPDPAVRITDDKPFNEYFLLGRLGLLGGHP